MIKGLYSAASAMLAGLYRQNVLSHNLSNIDTPGFRQVLTSLDDYRDTSVQNVPDGALGDGSYRLLGTLGLGVESGLETTDFTEGPMRETGQPLDLAIAGEGFFRVSTPDGERYTRDGRFNRDADGQVVSVDGYALLDDGGAALTLPEGEISVAADGTLTVAGQAAGRVGVAAFADPLAALARDPQAGNLFTAAGAPDGTAVGTIQQGYLESANVNPAQLMTQMVAVGRAYEAAQRLTQIQDELLGRTIATLGRL